MIIFAVLGFGLIVALLQNLTISAIPQARSQQPEVGMPPPEGQVPTGAEALQNQVPTGDQQLPQQIPPQQVQQQMLQQGQNPNFNEAPQQIAPLPQNYPDQNGNNQGFVPQQPGNPTGQPGQTPPSDARPNDQGPDQTNYGVPGDPNYPISISNPEGFVYDPTNRRDPFRPFLDDRQAQIKKDEDQPKISKRERNPLDQGPSDSLLGYDIEQFELVGVIWDVKDPKALIKTPSGSTFFVRKRTRIGRADGYVATIREGEVVVVELGDDGQTWVPRVISLGSKNAKQQ